MHACTLLFVLFCLYEDQGPEARLTACDAGTEAGMIETGFQTRGLI